MACGGLSAACPDGIDVYFENVGGAVTRAVARLLNRGSRVPICGFISLCNSEQDPRMVEPPHDIRRAGTSARAALLPGWRVG